MARPLSKLFEMAPAPVLKGQPPIISRYTEALAREARAFAQNCPGLEAWRTRNSTGFSTYAPSPKETHETRAVVSFGLRIGRLNDSGCVDPKPYESLTCPRRLVRVRLANFDIDLEIPLCHPSFSTSASEDFANPHRVTDVIIAGSMRVSQPLIRENSRTVFIHREDLRLYYLSKSGALFSPPCRGGPQRFRVRAKS